MARKKGKQSRRGSAPNRMMAAGQDLAQMLGKSAGSGYPPPEERQKIIDRRFDVMSKMLKEMVGSMVGDEASSPFQFLEKHDQRDTIMALNYLQRSIEHPSPRVDASWVYREYRRNFARWGGSRTFLNRSDWDAANAEYLDQVARREMAPIHFGPGKREKELRSQLLVASALWEDVVPQEAPPRPADFVSPPAGEYPEVLQPLLTWGLNTSKKQTGTMIGTIRQSNLPIAADLLRMALDEGLLAGWPGEPAAWAPEHVLNVVRAMAEKQLFKSEADILGFVQFRALAERADDWLSDEVPLVWSALGTKLEPTLKALLAGPAINLNQRLVLLEGLAQMAQDHPKTRAGVVEHLADLLTANSADEAEFNAEIIQALIDLDASETREAVQAAFDAGKVDEEIITEADVDWLED